MMAPCRLAVLVVYVTCVVPSGVSSVRLHVVLPSAHVCVCGGWRAGAACRYRPSCGGAKVCIRLGDYLASVAVSRAPRGECDVAHELRLLQRSRNAYVSSSRTKLTSSRIHSAG